MTWPPANGLKPGDWPACGRAVLRALVIAGRGTHLHRGGIISAGRGSEPSAVIVAAGPPACGTPVAGELGGRTGRGREMVRKVLLFVIPLAMAALAASQRQEIVRYLKVKQMSSGTGHPENVPVRGSHAYPDPGGGAADGTGDFDSAGR
jgi:hypothetical protein